MSMFLTNINLTQRKRLQGYINRLEMIQGHVNQIARIELSKASGSRLLTQQAALNSAVDAIRLAVERIDAALNL